MRQAVGMKALRAAACATEGGNFIIKMEGTIRASGGITRWMARGDSTIRVGNWPMRAAGHRTSSMA